MPTTEELFTDIDERLDQALSLTVGRMIEDRLEGHHLALAQDAADRLRSLCRSTRDRLAESEPVAYTATAELEGAEYFVIDDADTLTELSVFRTLASELAAMPQIAPSELDTTIKLYAIALGDDDERILFVRATNPQFRHTSGRFLAIGRERLRTVEGPIFAFAPDADFVVGPTWVVVLNQRSFEGLFRQIGLVEQHVATWITGITRHLPMSEDSIRQLREVALRDSRTWRRLRDIERRGHLAQVSLAEVQRYASRVGLDPAKVVVDGRLEFDPADRFGFLHLLNEDLYTGPLTGEPFESQRKAAMGD